MRDYSEKPIDRAKLVNDLESLIENKENSVDNKELVVEVAKYSLQLLEEYDNIVRCLAMQLSAGGFNSEGLMAPNVAYEKINWGINNLIAGIKNLALVQLKNENSKSEV